MLFSGGAFIKVDEARCLNYLHNGVGCLHCTSLCPGGALTVIEDKIFLEREQCLGCGVCFSNCPTEVFASAQWEETAIISEVKQQSAKTTQFFCAYHDEPYLSKNDKDKGAIQITACLAAVSKGAWYEIGLLTEVELRLEKCNECPMQKCTERLKYSLDTASEWLMATGHTPKFSLIHVPEEIQRRKKLKAVSSGMKVTSRRDLFLSLFNQGKEMIRKVRETGSAGHRNGKDTEKPLLPGWQLRLEKVYTDNDRGGENPAWWPSILKKLTCVNCGLCTKNCPSGALGYQEREGTVYHTFNSGRCLDCRICELFCPANSIVRGRGPNPRPFQTEMIYETKVKRCRKCGHQTVKNKEQLCYWCKHEAKEEDMIADVKNQLLMGL